MAKKKLFVTNGDESIYLHSENGTAYELAVGNDGSLTVTNEATGAVSGGGGDGLPTGGAPHQQLVTDAEGKALWEDRLAYAYTGMVEILPETVPVFNADAGAFFVTEPLAAPLAPGMNCEVTYNGMAYKCPVQEVANEDVTMLALGNVGVSTGGEDTGEPFVLVLIPDSLADQMPGVYAQLTPLDGADSVTISITGVVEKVKTIDPKFLPTGGSGSCGGGVIYIAETLGTTLVTATAYADEACTTALNYEQGKAIISKPFVITSNEEDMTAHAFPLLTAGNDAAKTATVIIFNMQDATPLFLTLTFSDTPT